MRNLFALLVGFWIAAPAIAHPLLEIQYDRTIAVRLDTESVFVTYTAEMNLLAMTLDGRNIVSPKDIAGQEPDSAFVRAYTERKAVLIADGLSAWLNKSGPHGRLHFTQITKPEIVREPGNTYRLVFKYAAYWVASESRQAQLALTGAMLDPVRSLWAPAPNRTHQFELEDHNYEAQPGFVKLTITEREINGDLSIINSVEPTDLWGKPLKLLNVEELARRNECSAEFTVKSNLKPREREEIVSAPTEPAPETTSAVRAVWDRGLIALFDTNVGITLVLLLAALFGVGHAFTPGHGKTMVAAYLVGERGTPMHAVVLGFTATLAHTGSVILLALILYSMYGNTAPAEMQGWLNMAGGLLIFLVGLWLLLQRIRGRADHVHLFSDHHHEPASPPNAKLGWLRVILLGLGGGIIPCWDAVLLFLLAMAQGRIGFAIPVLLAFSTGLALVLISLGLLVVYANRRGQRTYGDSRWFKLLPILSAAVLLGMGIWFLRDGWHELSKTAATQQSGMTVPDSKAKPVE